MSIKDIKRVIHGTCVVVDTNTDSSADAMPSSVRLTLQRPRGTCFWLGKKSKQVGRFSFPEGPHYLRYSHALFDLELLLKYSSKEEAQIKICVEQRQGVKQVAHIPLQEFLRQLLCTGRSEWFFLYIHREVLTLMPSDYSSHNEVPKWAFEGNKSDHKEETKHQRNQTEEVLVQEETTEEYINVTTEEIVDVEITSTDVNKITGNDETLTEEEKNTEETMNMLKTENIDEGKDKNNDIVDQETEWINYVESLYEKNKDEQDNDSGPMVDWITHVFSLSENKEEEKHYNDDTEDNDQVEQNNEVEQDNDNGPMVDWITHLFSLSENNRNEQDNNNGPMVEQDNDSGPMVDWITHVFSLSENKEEKHYNDDLVDNDQVAEWVNELRSLTENNEDEQDNNNGPMVDWITHLQSLSENNKNEQDKNNGPVVYWITHALSLSENKHEEKDNNDDDTVDNDQDADNDTTTDTQPLMNDYIEEEMADCSISVSRLMMSWYGAAIVVSFITLTAVSYEILQDGDWGWGWRGAFSMLSYFILTIALLDFIQEEN